jgi:hypothetical protein
MCYERAMQEKYLLEKLTIDTDFKQRGIINVDVTREINIEEIGKLLSKKN